MEHLSIEQVRDLMRYARARRERDWLMCLVGFWHGLRASEVVGLTAGCVRDGYVTVARLKGSLKTVQPLMKTADPLFDEATGLADWVAEMHSNQKLFPISRSQYFRLFQGYAAAVGIPERLRHPHVLKHTIAMLSIGKAGIEHVRQHLGHKSLSSTGAYLKVDDLTASKAVAGAVAASLFE